MLSLITNYLTIFLLVTLFKI